MVDSNIKVSLNDAIKELKEQIEFELSDSKIIAEYLKIIERFEIYHLTQNSTSPLKSLEEYYCIVTGAEAYTRPLTKTLRKKARPILMLRDLLQGKETQKRYSYNTIQVPNSFIQDFEHYKNWMTINFKSINTVRTRLGRIKVFLLFLESNNCSSISKLTNPIIIKFITSLSTKYSSHGNVNILYTLKNFFECPYIHQQLRCTPEYLLSNLHLKKHQKLPSFYSCEEIKKVLDAVDRSTDQGKMIYLIMLLAAVYGLRSSDIRELKISSLNLTQNTINLYQKKTKQQVNLPLIKVVLYAYLDYYKHARPNINSEFVFIKQRSPHVPYSTNNHFSNKVQTYFQKAQVNTENKHQGLHAMRHSLATELLSDNTPINEIASILGHTSIQATMAYIWSDIEHLRLAALEVLPYAK